MISNLAKGCKQYILHCNFVTNSNINEYSCPYSIIVKYYKKGIFSIVHHCEHNHEIDLDRLRIFKPEKNKLIEK